MVHNGEVTAVLGPNGAGKTTFVRTIATLVRPDAGSLWVGGVDAVRHPGQVRSIIGLAGQYAAVEPTMTGRENVSMVARLYGLTRRQAAANTSAVLAQLGLEEVADRPVKTYSGGLRRRLDLGASLVGAPRLLLLDEPTVASTRAAATTSGRRSAAWWPGGPTCCSRRSTSTRPTSSPSTWRSSTTGGSSPTAPRPSSKRLPDAT